MEDNSILFKSYNRIINCLRDSDRSTRKRTLKKVQKLFTELEINYDLQLITFDSKKYNLNKWITFYLNDLSLPIIESLSGAILHSTHL